MHESCDGDKNKEIEKL